MLNKIRWSHSRINTCLGNPAEYYLIYEEGISPITKKAALDIGSAVHHGLENNTAVLDDYYNTKGSRAQQFTYSDDQLLAESMCSAYLARKELIFNDLLDYNGTKLELLDEQHELELECNIPTNRFEHPHTFMGIIDLLLLTEQGWILCDYKTSGKDVEWDTYKSQLFKYICLLRDNFPEIPLFKICIINIKKTQIKRKKGENDDSYRRRIQLEYQLNEGNLIDYHIYTADEFSEENIKDYIDNMTGLIDLAQTIVGSRMFALNHNAIHGVYGDSAYAKIFYNVPGAEYLYKIKDKIWDEDIEDFVNERMCTKLDISTLRIHNALNHYKTFKLIADRDLPSCKTAEVVNSYIRQKFTVDEDLLNKYWVTYSKEKELEKEQEEKNKLEKKD